MTVKDSPGTDAGRARSGPEFFLMENHGLGHRVVCVLSAGWAPSKILCIRKYIASNEAAIYLQSDL